MPIRRILSQGRRPAVVIVGLAVLLLACVDAVVLHLVLLQRSHAIEHAQTDKRNLTTLIAQQTDRTFQSIDLTEKRIIDKLQAMGLDDGDDLRWIASQRVLHEVVVGEARNLDIVPWLTLVDERGTLVTTSLTWPPPPMNFAGRDYFKILSTHPELDRFVSRPVASGPLAVPSLYIARKIRGRGGDFAGLVIAAVPVAHFTELFDRVTASLGGNLFLMRDDGVVLAEGTAHSAPLALGAMDLAAADPSRTNDAAIILSGEPVAMTAVAPLARFPLRIAATQSLGSLLEPWRKETGVAGLMVLVFDASVLIATVLALRQLRESERIGRAEHHSARHDILTGLPNRSFFQEHLRRLDGAGGAVRPGLILLDLDNFKEVNDSLGHLAGDELLQAVARRLSRRMDEKTVLARLGGDEFAILKAEVGDREALLAFGRVLLEEFARPFELTDRLVPVSASLGAALREPGGREADLFEEADMALYQSKENGRNALSLFSPELNRQRQDQRRLLHDLRRAVDAQAFALHYQPIVDLSTCRITGFEALLRWTHPERGMVPPSVFIPEAEASGLILPLGAFVLREACRQATLWPETVTLSVNLSSVQIQSGSIVADVTAALRQSGLAAHRLEIEITESVLLDAPQARPVLQDLRALGVAIALDDFGTGFSSLSYLRSFPFHRIKIDRSFVAELTVDRNAGSIVRTIKSLGDQLGMAVTAEGIETHEQLRCLQALGPMSGQGYLISRPVPATDTAMLIEAYAVEAAVPVFPSSAPVDRGVAASVS